MCSLGELRDVWRRAEALGFEWISVWDHLYPAPSPLNGTSYEAVACHAALAASTVRPRVACLVYSSSFRHPAILAKAGVTIDHLSGGRLEMGIGAGWHQPEFDAFGIAFEPASVRLARMQEAVEVIRLLWTEDTVDYQGHFFTLRDAMCVPKPLQEAPRIWIGASGERRALAIAGRIGDGWNVPYVSPEDFARKLQIVKSASPHPDRLLTSVNLALIGATDDDVAQAVEIRFGPSAEKVRSGVLSGSNDHVADRVGRYVEAGADWIHVVLRAPFELDALQSFAESVLPLFA
jgi:alkanesulfonate monooxygenase SsuD/methylene tetrahydromethanopterin reductase-like flavin-dependent oxidoreductase (luciferase family)